MDKLGIVEVVAAALRTRATTSGTRRSPRTRWPCEASKVPTFFDGAYMVYFVEEEQRWGWTSTCSVLSAIVASQAATEKPVWAPRPSADNGAAGATVTPRSPLPGTARSREVLGLVGMPYALGQMHVL